MNIPSQPRLKCFVLFLGAWLLLSTANPLSAQEGIQESGGSSSHLDILPAQQWRRIDDAVDRALVFISRNQQSNGSFLAPSSGQPGVTSLCVMAFLSRGHVPGLGPYGNQLERAIDFVLSTQDAQGLLSYPGNRPNYNHAIAGLMLGEVYGMTSGQQSERIQEAIRNALAFSRMRQTRRKRNSQDIGGWRYLRPWGPNDSDLTASTWQLMFYRSAKNAEFDVPVEYIDDAMGYIHRCFDAREQSFVYALARTDERYVNGATSGGGIVSLVMAGEHDSEMAKAAGEWILRHPFDRYNRRQQRDDRYHYSAFYCSQAMFQLGGRYWEQFFPHLQETLLDNQRRDGSWDRESRHDSAVGNVYTTALSVLTLTTPYQILPIYQR